MVENQSARFHTWAAVVDVFAVGRGSLDYRLRHAPDVQNVVKCLLDLLDIFIRECEFHRRVDFADELRRCEE